MKLLDDWYNRRQLRKLDLTCDEFPTISGRIFVASAPDGRMTIGNGVRINSSLKANPAGGIRTVFMVMSGEAEIVLDEGAGISNVTIAAAAGVHVGREAFLGAGVRIYDTDFHSIHAAERLPHNVGIAARPVRVGDRAFIGAYATLLKGVTIGDGSVVGACSLVTASIPPGEVWGGVPARFLKKLPPYEQRDVPKFVTS